jgi:hypothetical protein
VPNQAKKEVPDSLKGQPASNAVTIEQSKKVDTNTQKEVPSSNSIATDQTKKVDSSTAAAKVPQQNTSTTKIM